MVLEQTTPRGELTSHDSDEYCYEEVFLSSYTNMFSILSLILCARTLRVDFIICAHSRLGIPRSSTRTLQVTTPTEDSISESEIL